MNSITFDTQTDLHLDAKDSLSPIPVIKLKGALKAQPVNATVALSTTDPNVTRDIRDFCKTTGHLYLGTDHLDGFDLHYIKKQSVTCETCSRARVVLGGLAAATALIFTAPSVVSGDPSAPITFVFLAALASLPPLAVNNARLLGEVIRTARTEN